MTVPLPDGPFDDAARKELATPLRRRARGALRPLLRGPVCARGRQPAPRRQRHAVGRAAASPRSIRRHPPPRSERQAYFGPAAGMLPHARHVAGAGSARSRARARSSIEEYEGTVVVPPDATARARRRRQHRHRPRSRHAMSSPMRSNVDPFLLEILKSSFDTIADDMALDPHAHGLFRHRPRLDGLLHGHPRPPRPDAGAGAHDADASGPFYDAMAASCAHFAGRMRARRRLHLQRPLRRRRHAPARHLHRQADLLRGAGCRGWAATLAHHADVGGIVPGSNALSAHEIYQEGLRIPLREVHRARQARCRASGTWWRPTCALPDKVMGDLQSQIAACAAGERELIESVQALRPRDRDGATTTHLHDYAERLARAAFRDIPDGTYRFTDHIDGLGEEPERCRVPARGDCRGRPRHGRLGRAPRRR